MLKRFKKIVLVITSTFLVLTSVLALPATAHAQTWYSQNPFEWYIKVYDPDTSPPNEIFGERYTAAQVQWVIWSLLTMPVRLVETVPGIGEKGILCIFKRIGTNTIDVSDCLGAIKENLIEIIKFIFPKIQAFNNKPFLALVFDSTGREISGIRYTKDLIKKFNPVTEVRAESYGFTGLTWLQKFWKGFRDMSYALLVLIIIVFAFMIMFRVKISPQLVISIQSALPKVVIALILITFSYAIAGFAIDLMYVVSGLFALLLKMAGFSNNINAAFGTISGTGGGYSAAGGFWIFFFMLVYGILFIISAFLSIFSSILGGLSIFGAIVSIIFMFIGVWVLILMLIYTVKVPLVLLKTLISLYLSIVTAPIQILAGVIVPAMGFGAWFKKLMADILVFPVTGLLVWFAWATLMLSYARVGLDIWEGLFDLNAPEIWAPGIIGSAHEMTGIILLAISFGIIVLIPKVPELLKSMIMGEKFSFGTAIGEAVGPLKAGWGMTGAPVTRAFQEIGSKASIARIAEGVDTRLASSTKAPQWLKDIIGNMYAKKG